jgi:chitinase
LFATFDDERSNKAKAKFIRQKKLGGIMFYELKNDKKTSGLIDATSRQLN